MSKLNEYIGGIVSSITSARAMCDMQTVEIARQYAEHSLLQHFSVPRMRIEDIEMTIPVAMDVQDADNGQSAVVDTEKMSNAVIDAGLDYTSVMVLSKEMSIELRRYIAKEAEMLRDPKNPNSDATRLFSEKMADYFRELAAKAGVSSEINTDALTTKISQTVRAVANDNAAIGNMNVIIEAGRLRELQPESIIYIKMKIREDGMEWSVAENSDGTTDSKLLPE